jgi:predicted nuclease of predicted toxin-antitoxin system
VKVKLDENIPATVASRLARLGVDTDTVLDESLGGHRDADVWSAARREERLFVTQDLDFSDAR